MPVPGIVYKFGPFVFRSRSKELYKGDIKLKLRPQTLRILELLVERSGDLVTRAELQKLLWAGRDFGDFEQGLNNTVRELRSALVDSANEPRYIETLPRLGYRIIVPVETVPGLDNFSTSPPIKPTEQSDSPSQKLSTAERKPKWLYATIIAVLLIAVITEYVRWKPSHIAPQEPARRPMLAVLPFDNLTGDPGQDYFSDGFTEEMIAQLGRLEPQRLGVIARTSVMRFKHNQAGIENIGPELGVQYVLEGSVRRDADNVRISAELIQLKDHSHIWSREYDRKLNNLLTLQSEIAHEIAGEILRTLNNKNSKEALRQIPITPEAYEAYDLYLKGLYFWNKRSPEGFEKAVDYFQKAVNKDPSNARAYVGLAASYALIGGYTGVPPVNFIEKARTASRRAIELDDSLAEAHTGRAVVAQNLDWDWKTAEHEYRRAIELDPNYATAHHWFAEYLALMGRFEEASVEIEQARMLDPLSLIIASDHGAILYYARHYDQAIEQFRTVLEMDPTYARAGTIDLVYLEKGMYSEAQSDFEKRRSLFNQNPWYVGLAVYIDARSGRTVEARHSLDRLQQMNRTHHIDPLIFAYAYLGLKEKNQALNFLEKAYAEHSVSLTAVKVDPLYDPIRNEPRFRRLLLQMGLAP
jgi:TolB-like protein/DNA-binding winged helix-turn-helix (wHTH) protein/Tfp pilus assembly protein PilF